MEPTKQQPNNPIDASIEQVDATFAVTDEIRMDLIHKLQNTVMSTLIAPGEEKPLATEAKLHLVQTLATLLKDHENGAVTKAKVRLQKKEADNSAAAQQIVGEFLRTLNISNISVKGTATIIPSDLDESITRGIKETNKDITDAELSTNEENEQKP